MTVALDTSVLVAAFTPDVHTAKAEHWLSVGDAFLVSDWAAAEFSAAIRNKVRQNVVQAAMVGEVEAAFDAFSARLGGKRPVLAQDHVATRLLVSRHDSLRAPDALHIAVAARLGARLATFDRRQAEAVAAEGLGLFEP